MPLSLVDRSFLTLEDHTPDEIRGLLDLSAELKAAKAWVRAFHADGAAYEQHEYKDAGFQPGLRFSPSKGLLMATDQYFAYQEHAVPAPVAP